MSLKLRGKLSGGKMEVISTQTTKKALEIDTGLRRQRMYEEEGGGGKREEERGGGRKEGGGGEIRKVPI